MHQNWFCTGETEILVYLRVTVLIRGYIYVVWLFEELGTFDAFICLLYDIIFEQLMVSTAIKNLSQPWRYGSQCVLRTSY